jgi:hypothetical protein
MNNREVIDQVERGYRMAQPSHITYPESKTMPKEVAIAQANVYKVSPMFGLKETNLKLHIFLYNCLQFPSNNELKILLRLKIFASIRNKNLNICIK